MVVVKTIYKPCPDLAEKLVPAADKEAAAAGVRVRSNGQNGGDTAAYQRVAGSGFFQWLVCGYKVFLIISTIVLIASLSMVAFAAILIAERQQSAQDPMTEDEVAAVRDFYSCLPLMFLSMAFCAIQLTIAWISIMTLRVQYLRTNLYLQLGLLAVAIVRLVASAGDPSPRPVVGILVQLIEVCVLHSIIDHGRKQQLLLR